jgi:hypothetical protein
MSGAGNVNEKWKRHLHAIEGCFVHSLIVDHQGSNLELVLCHERADDRYQLLAQPNRIVPLRRVDDAAPVVRHALRAEDDIGHLLVPHVRPPIGGDCERRGVEA